jgi:hypothetical protein
MACRRRNSSLQRHADPVRAPLMDLTGAERADPGALIDALGPQ